jgi:hypothetical protein
LLDGWMYGWRTSSWQVQCHNHHQWPHPLRRSNSNAEPLQPQVTLRWRLPPPVFTAATLPSPTPHLRSSRPRSPATSRSFCLSFLPCFCLAMGLLYTCDSQIWRKQSGASEQN